MRWYTSITAVCIFILGISTPAISFSSYVQDEKNLPYLAQRYGVPVTLLYAIKDAESDGNPYAFHLQSRKNLTKSLESLQIKYGTYTKNGVYHYSVKANSYEQACRILQYITPMCEKFDTGWFQISEYWIKSQKLRPVDLLNPTYNAAWGAKILSICFNQERGDLWKSVECYNRGSSKGRLTSYSWRVYHAHLKQLAQVSQQRIQPVR